MPHDNPFPESAEKDYLRKYHLLHSLADLHESIGRSLNYLGLPSAEMRDVEIWQPLLGRVAAIERDPEVALSMYRTAQCLGIRERTVVLEKPLIELINLLAMEEREAKLSLSTLWPGVREKIDLVRHTVHDVINLDLCGGFLYTKQSESANANTKRNESANAKMLRQLIEFQAKQRNAFILILTFALRDMGKDDYTEFIKDALDHLDSLRINTDEIKQFYTAKKIEGQPPNLRRLRFCVPTYLHKIAFDHFQVSSLGAWYYKTFYHTVLFFEPRKGKSVLGRSWPPLDEFKALLRANMIRVEKDESGQIVLKKLLAPSLD